MNSRVFSSVKNLLFCLCLAALSALLLLRLRQEPVALPPAPSAWDQFFQTAQAEPPLAGAAIGFCLLDAQGQVVFERQGNTAFIPASTLKTLTTATALEKWGPDFRIQTTLRSSTPLKAGVISGDVILLGGADPMLSLADLESWAETLKQKGLRQITGRIIGKGDLLTGSIFDDFWNWGDIGNGYGSGVSGLNLEHNRFTAGFHAGAAEGDKATLLGTFPEVPGVRWIQEVTTGPKGSGDGIVIHGGERTQTLHFRGTVPLKDGEIQVTGAVPDPELFAAHHLREILIQQGISVEGKATTQTELRETKLPIPEAKEELLNHASPQLIEIITSIHETSDNHETECLYRLLALHENKAADIVIRDHWRARGLEFIGLRMEDGCGLARADFIRPLDLARLQHLVLTGPHGSVYRDSLLGSDDGQLRWKGGAMSGVRSYTGWVKAASGAEFTFALMVNHFTDGQAVSALRDKVMAALRGL